MSARGGMIATFFSLKGNPRACLWTEPLWAIPYNLYLPYVALYMRGLGITPAEIGYITSISLLVQIVASALSGVLADKMGRRLCTLVIDLIAWTIPTLLWAFARSYGWFVAAALFNGLWRVTTNSWGLLLTEDTDDELVVRCFSLAQLTGLLAAFIAPVSKIAVDIYGVVPTMRALYLFAAVSMTLKLFLLYRIGTETQMGLKRLAQTKDISVWRLIWDCKDIFLELIRQKRMLFTIGVLAVFQIVTTLNTSFWAVFITEQLAINPGDVALYTTFKSLIIMACIFLLIPRIRFSRFKPPMLLGWGVFGVSQILLLAAPGGSGVGVLIASTAFEALALALLAPLVDSLLFINAEPSERARILGLIYGLMTLIVAGFPALAGKLMALNPGSPFWINLVMLVAGSVLTAALWRERQRAD